MTNAPVASAPGPRTVLVAAVAALATVAALALPTAAHITVTVDPLTQPLQVGVPTAVTVRFSEPCFEMPVETASGNDALTAALAATAPAFATGTGETVPWTLDGCEPSTDPMEFGGVVRAAAVLTLVVDGTAPGITNISIPVTYIDANGASTDGVPLNVTVAHHANGTLTATRPGHGAGHGAGHAAHGGNGTPILLTLDYTTNAESLLTFEARSDVGTVLEVDAVNVKPPSFDGKQRSTATATATFVPPAQWTVANLEFAAYLTPVAGGPRIAVANATLALANDAVDAAGGHGTHSHGDPEGGKDAPAPGLALALLALALVAIRRR